MTIGGLIPRKLNNKRITTLLGLAVLGVTILWLIGVKFPRFRILESFDGAAISDTLEKYITKDIKFSEFKKLHSTNDLQIDRSLIGKLKHTRETKGSKLSSTEVSDIIEEYKRIKNIGKDKGDVIETFDQSCVGAIDTLNTKLEAHIAAHRSAVEDWENEKESYRQEWSLGKLQGEAKLSNPIGTSDGIKNETYSMCPGEGDYLKSFDIEDTNNFVQRIKNIRCAIKQARPNNYIGSSKGGETMRFTARDGGERGIALKQYYDEDIVGIQFGGKKYEHPSNKSNTSWSSAVCPEGTVIKGFQGASKRVASHAIDAPVQLRVYCEPLNYVRNAEGKPYETLEDYAVKGKGIGERPEYIPYLDPAAIQCQDCRQFIDRVRIESSSDAAVQNYSQCVQRVIAGGEAATPPITDDSQTTSTQVPPQSPPKDSSDDRDDSPPRESAGDGLSTGAMVGIGVASLVALVSMIAVIALMSSS